MLLNDYHLAGILYILFLLCPVYKLLFILLYYHTQIQYISIIIKSTFFSLTIYFHILLLFFLFLLLFIYLLIPPPLFPLLLCCPLSLFSAAHMCRSVGYFPVGIWETNHSQSDEENSLLSLGGIHSPLARCKAS